VSSIVLDASAVTAVLRKERGYENVVPVLRGALISTVNLAEVLCTVRLKNSDPVLDEQHIKLMELRRVPFDEHQSQLVASIYKATLGSTLGLADRACLALGLSRGLPVLTSDSEWMNYSVGVEVRLFRERNASQ
jgi:ribonuclease VapC